jgi:hypothetical protein
MTKLHKLIELQIENGDEPHEIVESYDSHFVGPDEVLDVLGRSDIKAALTSLIEAGIMELPYPEVLMEFNSSQGATRFVWLKKKGGFVVGRVALMTKEAVAISGKWITLEFRNTTIWTSASASPSTDAIIIGFTTALLLLNLRGIRREVVESPRLNTQRIARGKPPVPKATVLHIGKVYSQSGERVAHDNTDRRKASCFLRAGHVRHQRIGAGRTQGKLIFIEPTFVSYDPDGEALKKLPRAIKLQETTP